MIKQKRSRGKKKALVGQTSLFPPTDAHYCVAIDVETTGLKADIDRVLQLGVVLGDHNFTSIWEGAITIDPEVVVPENVVEIHGLSNEIVDGCVSFDVAGRWLAPLITNKVVVGHNVRFDLDFLTFEYKRLAISMPDIAGTVDSLSMSKFLLPHLKSHKLERVCSELKIEITRSHDACYDAAASLRIVKALAEAGPGYIKEALTISKSH